MLHLGMRISPIPRVQKNILCNKMRETWLLGLLKVPFGDIEGRRRVLFHGPTHHSTRLRDPLHLSNMIFCCFLLAPLLKLLISNKISMPSAGSMLWINLILYTIRLDTNCHSRRAMSGAFLLMNKLCTHMEFFILRHY